MLDGCRDLDILALLQPFLTLYKVVDTINDQLHQFHLAQKSRVTPESYAHVTGLAQPASSKIRTGTGGGSANKYVKDSSV